jgi:hypothetical protein
MTSYFTKLLRNSFILAGINFMSLYIATDDILLTCKPTLIFLGSYILADLAHHYRLSKVEIKIKKKNPKLQTLIF